MTRNQPSLGDDFRPPHGAMPAQVDSAPMMPCRWCQAPTQRATLGHYGARCFRCYEAFLLDPQKAVDVGDKRKSGPRDWAHALKRREEAGEKLSPAQREMWRAAIGAHQLLDGVRQGSGASEAEISDALRVTGDIPWAERGDVPAFDEFEVARAF